MKFILMLFFTFFLTACSNVERKEIIPDHFKGFMGNYFKGYEYDYKDTNARGNKNYGEQYALFKIKKTDLNQDEIKNIYKKLEGEGWRLVETNNKNYVNFCYGEDFSLIILFPLGKLEKTPSGIPLSYDDNYHWYISLYKSTAKLAACNQNQNDFIDFTKL
ncbi:hypothetical protein BJD20_16230 [Acinetobacter proteolyticus]|uniref:hypothetical protein n=1 Tax=Acinetobacter proteolyticus TaxID=1776741 RepID=UPI0008633C32|nr:hypothetical protein [Acinetobacter proteolyticus]OEY95278.1 hypothetical protein BJD20_16230 [Acinetobacter proteolyticus]